MTNNRKSFETDIEKQLREEIERRGYRQGIDFACQFPIRYGHILDFAFPDKKLAIEADGERWHSSKRARRRDAIKNSVLKKKGWKIIRFSGIEIKTDCAKCVATIESCLNDGF